MREPTACRLMVTELAEQPYGGDPAARFRDWRIICSSVRRVSRPELAASPRVRFSSAYPGVASVCDSDPDQGRGSRLPCFLSQAPSQAFAIILLSGAGL